MLRNMIIVYMMSRIGGKPIHKKGNSVCAIRSKSQEMGGGGVQAWFLLFTRNMYLFWFSGEGLLVPTTVFENMHPFPDPLLLMVQREIYSMVFSKERSTHLITQ